MSFTFHFTILIFVLTFLSLSLVTVSSECPSPEMRRFGNSCFWLDDTVLSYNLAETKCKRQGGHLAMPVDQSTQQFLQDLIRAGRYDNYWVGIREVEHSRWIFSDRSPVRDFTYWAQNEPSGAADEDCVFLGVFVQSKWITTQCHWGYRFICQRPVACDVNALDAFNLKIQQSRWTFQRTEYHLVGSSVNVDCKDGYSGMTGPNKLHCEIGGVWTNSTRCFKKCPQPNLQPNVRLLRAQGFYDAGHSLQLECDRDKILVGNLTCNKTGIWIGETPKCVPVPVTRTTTSTTSTTSTTQATLTTKIAENEDCLSKFGVEKRELRRTIDEPQLIEVKSNSDVYLPCTTNIGKWPHGMWLKEQDAIDHSNTSNVRVLRNGTLYIPRMTSATEGLYTCIAFSSTKRDDVNVNSVRLVLTKRCHFHFDNPPSLHLLSGTDFVLLKCHARNAIITWMRHGKKITGDADHIFLPNSVLLIRRTLDTMGEYSCRADHLTSRCRIERGISVPIEGPLEEVCGRARVSSNSTEDKNGKSHGKLVGGHVAPKGSHPWIVIFVKLMNERETFLCAGNLLNHRWIVTAAHCFYWIKSNEDLVNLRAKLGKYDRLESEQHEKVVSVERIVRHPDFDTSLKSFDNDIAVVRMSESIAFTDSIIPICLPSNNFLGRFLPVRYSLSSGTVSGWGNLEEGGLQPRYLHQVRLPLVESPKCEESTRQHVTHNMFCAGYEEAVGDSCQGDSGGPFEMYDNGIAYLAGIVSWGEGCGRPGNYGFYTKVENYLSFVREYSTSNTVKY